MKFNFIRNTFIILVFAYFFYLMCIITLRYIPINYEVSFLSIKQTEIQLTHYKVAFFTHVYTSIFVLLLGFFQFFKWIRIKYKSLHRILGKIYVFLILVFSSTSGLVLAVYANGGVYSKISFILLSVFWFYFTFMAFYYAKKQNWTKHKHFMYRSYALTLSAVSLRLFKWIIANSFEIGPMETYRIVAWLGWIFNWCAAEILIRLKNKSSLI